MGSTIDSSDLLEYIAEFESYIAQTSYGAMTLEEYSELSEEDQAQVLAELAASGDIDTDDFYTLSDNLYEMFSALIAANEDAVDNATDALAQATASANLADLQTQWEVVQNLSTSWGDAQDYSPENLEEKSGGSDISDSAAEDYDGMEKTLDASEVEDDNWVSDPHADNDTMIDSDGDGYKDTVIWQAANQDREVTNLQGVKVTEDTDGDGDVDQYDGLTNASIPTVSIDLDGGAWELMDYDPDTYTYRVKIYHCEDEDVVAAYLNGEISLEEAKEQGMTESYRNIIGPCYIALENGTPPDQSTLEGYGEDVLRILKESSVSDTTVGDILYGEYESSLDRTIFMNAFDGNIADVTVSDEDIAAGAVFNIEFEGNDINTLNLNVPYDTVIDFYIDSEGVYCIKLTDPEGNVGTIRCIDFDTNYSEETDVLRTDIEGNTDVYERAYNTINITGGTMAENAVYNANTMSPYGDETAWFLWGSRFAAHIYHEDDRMDYYNFSDDTTDNMYD